MQSGPDRIPVTSTPEGALVFFNGIELGVTPLVVNVHRDQNCVLEFKLSGYQTVTITKNKVVAGWVFGNVILGGLFGLAVDLITHNQGKYSEDHLNVVLPVI
jgi:hypothetical protein